MRPPDDAGLAPIRDAFERFARADPMYAALSKRGHDGGRWDPDAFFARGRSEISDVLDYVTSLGLDVPRGAALDFGCAIGRLTQALAGQFEEVVGVDIADSMLAAARSYNQYGSRVEYVLNTGPALNFAADRSFDFVYSNKVLQHIPPEYQAAYITEFVRVLRPGGSRGSPDTERAAHQAR
jgi:2-polyprenyl-3-methyl-5-hydroxy-6-metoxy-1,4-benzoquinol methylase